MNSIRVAFFDIGETLVRSRTGNPPELVNGAFEMVKELRARGIRTGIISNTGDLTREQLVDFLPDGFDFDLFEPSITILSSDPEIGVEKPSSAIFALAYSRATRLISALSPSECLFCGENLVETLAAQAAGFLGLRVLLDADGNTEISSLLSVLDKAGIRS